MRACVCVLLSFYYFLLLLFSRIPRGKLPPAKIRCVPKDPPTGNLPGDKSINLYRLIYVRFHFTREHLGNLSPYYIVERIIYVKFKEQFIEL